MSQLTQILLALVIGLGILIYLVIKTKVHPILALVFVAAFIGIVGGVDLAAIPGAISTGFGNTLAGIGLVIGFGVMMGQILEDTGSAKVLARTFLKLCGQGREEWALGLTGFVTSIPIFSASAFVILAPLAKAVSRAVNKSVIGLGVALGASLMITHASVPPTPGPLGAAGIFGVNVGYLILFGIVMGLPIMAMLVLFSKWVSRNYFAIPDDEGVPQFRPYEPPRMTDYLKSEDESHLPTPFQAFTPILLPVVLILVSSILTAIYPKTDIVLINFFKFIGSPVISVGLGLFYAIYGLTRGMDRAKVMAMMDKGLKTTGIIVLVTGAGGSLGQIIRVSGAGDVLAKALTQSSIPLVLLPFIISAALRFIQGSGTVAMITTASICAPILANTDVNMLFACWAACIGSQIISYHNDSYFWVVTTTLGITDTKTQLKAWTLASPVLALTGLVELLIVNAIFG